MLVKKLSIAPALANNQVDALYYSTLLFPYSEYPQFPLIMQFHLFSIALPLLRRVSLLLSYTNCILREFSLSTIKILKKNNLS